MVKHKWQMANIKLVKIHKQELATLKKEQLAFVGHLNKVLENLRKV